MNNPEIDIKHVAYLCRIVLTPEEETMFARQLGEILRYMDILRRVDVTGIEPTAHATELTNVFRPDTVVESLPHQLAMANAPARRDGLFIVPKIVE